MLNQLHEAEESLVEQQDWEEILGSLRDKVDSIKFIRDRLQSAYDFYDREVDRLKAKKTSIQNNLDNLLNYVNNCMKNGDFEQIPGKKWIIATRKNPPTIEIKDDASADYFLNFENFVKRQIIYTWKKNEIKEALAEGELPVELEKLVSKTQNTRIVFQEKIGE